MLVTLGGWGWGGGGGGVKASLYTVSNPLNFFGLGSLLLILVPPNF